MMNFIDPKIFQDCGENYYLSEEEVFKDSAELKETFIVGDFILWIEQRPAERGRNTCLIRKWMQKNNQAFELIPSWGNIGSGFHGYGGSALSVQLKENTLSLTWIDKKDGCLWLRSFEFSPNNKFTEISQIKCLSHKSNDLYANGTLDLKKNKWIGLMEREGKDYIISFSLDKEEALPDILYQVNGFIGYLCFNSKYNQIAWIEWCNEFMPWDKNILVIANISKDNKVYKTFHSGDQSEFKNTSFFQPYWVETNKLVVSNDKDGWWNPILVSRNNDSNQYRIIDKLIQKNQDCGTPQWVLGMSTIGNNNGDFVFLFCSSGVWSIFLLSHTKDISKIDQPFTYLSNLIVRNNKLISLAGDALNHKGLLEIDLKTKNWKYSEVSKPVISKAKICVPESLWFKGFNNLETHAWFYRPKVNIYTKTPLLVKCHSGPTNVSNSLLNLEIQFWTSRGWAILDVNYGGSSGFGREYRQRLNGYWGIVDIYDCIFATKEILKNENINPNLIAIEGGSAGGFTALGCLSSSNLFSAAACKYPVSNLKSMQRFTHRFEKSYLNTLIGDFDINQKNYIERSPINKISKIKNPIIFFHGEKDKVISPSETFELYSKLKNQNIDTELHIFKDEGHGFKKGENKSNVLKLTEQFFNKHLNIMNLS